MWSAPEPALGQTASLSQLFWFANHLGLLLAVLHSLLVVAAYLAGSISSMHVLHCIIKPRLLCMQVQLDTARKQHAAEMQDVQSRLADTAALLQQSSERAQDLAAQLSLCKAQVHSVEKVPCPLRLFCMKPLHLASATVIAIATK